VDGACLSRPRVRVEPGFVQTLRSWLCKWDASSRAARQSWLPEEIDLLNATRAAEQLTSAVRRNPAVIIDTTATMFCDCAGARAIVQAHKRATGSGAELRL